MTTTKQSLWKTRNGVVQRLNRIIKFLEKMFIGFLQLTFHTYGFMVQLFLFKPRKYFTACIRNIYHIKSG